MVVLGDHQPNTNVSGTGVSHDVPISLIAHDPAVLRADLELGLDPRAAARTADGPVMPMDDFRDRFLVGVRRRTPADPPTTPDRTDRAPGSVSPG